MAGFDGLGVVKAEQELWQGRYTAFRRLYRGRHDVIAERGDDGKYVDLVGNGLTFERFVDHVHMNRTYAVYNKDDDGKVGFALFDLDVFPRDQGWDKILLSLEVKRQETKRIMTVLTEIGLARHQMLVEFPTVGYHLLLFFDQPVSARSVKLLMRHVLQLAQVDKVPFYPKKVDEGPWGDRVQLPLRINLNTNRRSNFVRDVDTFDPLRYETEPDFSVLDEIAPIPAEWVESVVENNRL